MAVILPDTVWEWKTPVIYKDYEAVNEFYEAEKNRPQLFPPPPFGTVIPPRPKGKKKEDEQVAAKPKEEEVQIPVMLGLPTCILKQLIKRTSWTPYELLKIVDEQMEDYDIQVEKKSWNVLREWCLAATQLKNPTGSDSVMGVTIEAILQDDDVFQDWMES